MDLGSLPITQRLVRRYGWLHLQLTPNLPNVNFNLCFFHQFLAWKFPPLPKRERKIINELFVFWIKYQNWSTRRFLQRTGLLRIKQATDGTYWGKIKTVFLSISFSFSQNRVLPLQVYKVKITLIDSKCLLFFEDQGNLRKKNT